MAGQSTKEYTTTQQRISSAEYRATHGLPPAGQKRNVIDPPKVVTAGPVSKAENKTELRYARYLDWQITMGAIEARGTHESIALRLAAKTWYRPDYPVWTRQGQLEFHEVKATNKKTGKPIIEDDARVKIKGIAEQFPHFVFVVTWLVQDVWYQEVFNGDR